MDCYPKSVHDCSALLATGSYTTDYYLMSVHDCSALLAMDYYLKSVLVHAAHAVLELEYMLRLAATQV